MIQTCKLLTDKHYELLSLADDNQKAINDYTSRGEVFVFVKEGQPVGIVVGLLTRPNTFELVNLAVDSHYQHQGIGKQLINYII